MEQKHWEDNEIKQMVELEKTMTHAQVAKEMGRTKDSVRHKLKWLKEQGIAVPTTIKAVKKEEVRQAKEKVKEAKPLRKKEQTGYVSYPPLEWCGECHAPVSNWRDHAFRMGCKKPA